jgi:hypothetical protein
MEITSNGGACQVAGRVMQGGGGTRLHAADGGKMAEIPLRAGPVRTMRRSQAALAGHAAGGFCHCAARTALQLRARVHQAHSAPCIGVHAT